MSELLKQLQTIPKPPAEAATPAITNLPAPPQSRTRIFALAIAIAATLGFLLYKKFANHRQVPTLPAAVDPVAQYQQALALYRQGNSQAALELMQAVQRDLELEPDLDGAVQNLMGVAALKIGNLELAQLQLQAAVANHPQVGPYLGNLGMLYFKQARLDFAEEVLRKGLELIPSSPELNLNMAQINERTGSYGDAVTHLATYLREGKPDSQTKLAIGERLRILRSLARGVAYNATAEGNHDVVK